MNIQGIGLEYKNIESTSGAAAANAHIDSIIEEVRGNYCLLAPHHYADGEMLEDDARQFEIVKRQLEAIKA